MLIFSKSTGLSTVWSRKSEYQGVNVYAVGDSKYDVEFLKNAGLGIAYKNDKDLINAADVVITDLEARAHNLAAAMPL